MLPAKDAVLTHDVDRITYDQGSVIQWCLNGTNDLDQGLTRSVPLEEHRSWPQARAGREHAPLEDEPLDMIFAFEGTPFPVLSADGQLIDFVTRAGARPLRYAALGVTDASGGILPARMEGRNEDG